MQNSYRLIITDPAIADMKTARDWYIAQQPDLGNKFLDALFKHFETINQMPFAYPSKYKYTREFVVKRFPYIIVYTIEEHVIFILRVFPSKTNPEKKYK